jgi:polysaccharide biosynthesis transport protein
MSEEQNKLMPAPAGQLPARPEVIETQAYAAPPGGGYPSPMVEDDEAPGLVEYWRVLRRRKGTVILIAALGLLAGALVTLPQTPIYQAKTTLEMLELNENFMNMKDVREMAQSSGFNVTMDIQTQIKLLQSESLIERTLRSLKYKPVEEMLTDTDRLSTWRRMLNLPGGAQEEEDARNAALKMASKETKVKASGQTRIIEVTVESTDPKVATEYANQLGQDFIEQNMEARWKMTQRTGEFLTKQLDDMRAKLERSEDSLQEYARRNGLIFTNEKTNVSEEKLRQLQEELTKASTDRVMKQSNYELAASAPAESLPDILNDPILRDYQAKLTELRRQEADLAETYTDEHPKVRRVEAQVATVERSLDRQRADILRRIRNEYDQAMRRERLLLVDYRQQTGVVTDQGEKAVQYNILKREVDSNRGIYDSMLQRMKEASVASALKASNVRVVDPAKIPKLPYKPKVLLNAGLGLLGGLFFGVAFVVLTERADRTMQEPGDIGFYLNVPELGMIPSDHDGLKSRRGLFRKNGELKLVMGYGHKCDRKALAMVTYKRKPSMMAESFRSALTSILFTGQNGNRPKMMVVTSPSPGEGKTTVATNLAIAMAETGQRVLLIDGDTLKPRMHEIFELNKEPGFTDLLQAGPGVEERTADYLQATEVPNLTLLPAGKGVAGATNLLCSNNLKALMTKFQAEYDLVIIDTPPMLQIPDARVIGRLAQGVVLVVRASKTTRNAAMAARSRLREDGTKVIGTVMNDWNPKKSPGGYYGYYDGYKSYYPKYGYYGHSG